MIFNSSWARVIYQNDLEDSMDIMASVKELLERPEIFRRKRPHIPILIVFVLTLLWFLGATFSPYLVDAGTINLGDDGVVGTRDFTHTISQIDSPVAKFFYDAGDVNCHQKASRSYFLNDNQMPFCARDAAIFMGLAIGVLAMVFISIELNIFWIILGLVPMGIDGTTQLLFDSYESTNFIRLITGMIAGIVIGIALGYIIGEFSLISKERKMTKNMKEK